MLEYSDIKPGTFIILDGNPYEVCNSHVFRKQQRKAVNQTKLRNLITGSVREETFQQSDKAEEATLENRTITYIYSKPNEHWFHEKNDPSARFALPDTIVGDASEYLTENVEVSALVFNPDENDDWIHAIVRIEVPIKMEFEVTDAPPNIKGNTAQGGNKQAAIETGKSITVPMFIETGDRIVVNTQTGEYAGRAKQPGNTP